MGLLNEIEKIEEAMLLEASISNEQVVRNFLSPYRGDESGKTMGDFSKSPDDAEQFGIRSDRWNPMYGSTNLKTTRIPLDKNQPVIGWSLNFNATPIIFLDNDNNYYFNTDKTSFTSISKVQTIIRKTIEANQLADKVREVDSDTIVKLIKGESVDNSVLNKISDEIPEPEVSTEETPTELPTETSPEIVPEKTQETTLPS